MSPKSAGASSLSCPHGKNEIYRDKYSVDDLKSSLEDVLNDPRLAAHVLKNHELTVNAIHESADTSGKRKRRRMNLPEPALEHPEVTALQRKLDSVKLKSWPFLLDSAAFLRGPRFTDLNPFTEPVCKRTRPTTSQSFFPAEACFAFLSEIVVITERSYGVFESRSYVDRDGVLPIAISVDRRGSQLATCRVIFSKSWRAGEVHTMCIKRDAGGGLRG